MITHVKKDHTVVELKEAERKGYYPCPVCMGYNREKAKRHEQLKNTYTDGE